MNQVAIARQDSWLRQLGVASFLAVLFGVLIARNAPSVDGAGFLWLLFVLCAGIVLGSDGGGRHKRLMVAVGVVTTVNGLAILGWVVVGTLVGLTGLTVGLAATVVQRPGALEVSARRVANLETLGAMGCRFER